MIFLPTTNLTWPLVRILTAPSWQGGQATWTPLPMVGPGLGANGYEVLSWSRVALPAVGEALIRYRYGKVNGAVLAPSPGQGTTWDPAKSTIQFPNLRGQEIRIQAAPDDPAVTDPTKVKWRTVWWGTCEFQENEAWGGSSLPAGDMLYHCIDGFARTRHWPLDRHGVFIEGGVDNGLTGLCWGHPGYNVVDHNGITRGNLDPSLVLFDPTAGYGLGVSGDQGAGDGLCNVYYHTWSGAGTGAATNQNGASGNIWSDRQAVNHAMNVCRPKNEPSFLLNNTMITTGSGFSLYFDEPTLAAAINVTPITALPVGNAWKVGAQEVVWEFVNKVCRRERGVGVVFCDWADDSAAPLGPLTIQLTARPQTQKDITYQIPTPGGATVAPTGGNQVKLPGSDSYGSSYAQVDLIGDQRLLAGSLKINDREQNRVDYLESCGERIQVAVTLSALDSCNGQPSLFKNWLDSQAQAFQALQPLQRINESWRPVYQLYRLPHNFLGWVGDHDSGASIAVHRADYRCTDDGSVTNAPAALNGALNPNGVKDTSSLLCTVLPDMPFLEGYDYSKFPPVRYDKQVESGAPQRRPPVVLVRMAANMYVIGEQLQPNGASLSIAHDGIMIACSGDTSAEGAFRSISVTPASLNVLGITVATVPDAGLGAVYNTQQLGLSCAIELPHFVRFASLGVDFQGKPVALANVRRRKKIFHANLHLWLASPGCIWDVQGSLINAGAFPGNRTACGGSLNSPGILRDDRGALAVRHALAYNWYCIPRRTCSYTLRDCGFLPSFTTTSDPAQDAISGKAQTTTAVPFPQLGQVIATLSANGQIQTIGTPITSMSYNHISGETTWSTDWSELDFVS